MAVGGVPASAGTGTIAGNGEAGTTWGPVMRIVEEARARPRTSTWGTYL